MTLLVVAHLLFQLTNTLRVRNEGHFGLAGGHGLLGVTLFEGPDVAEGSTSTAAVRCR